MSKYAYTDKCDEISGFGEGYEECCRKMVIAGLEWFDEHENADPKFQGFKNVFGLLLEKNEDAEKLTKHMNNAINGEATGAMMQACLDHVKYAKHHGWDKYIEVMEKREESNCQ
jgi:hypothetical protein